MPGLFGVADVSMTVTGYLCCSAQRRYMRRSISAKSEASTPPAPARIVTTAGRSSYSPSSRVCTSSSPDDVLELGELVARLVGRVLVVHLVGELDEHFEVVEASLDVVDAGELGLPVAEGAGDLLRLLGVVPEVGHTGLFAEVARSRR